VSASWLSKEADWLPGRRSWPCTAALSSHAACAPSLHRAGLAQQIRSISTFLWSLAARGILHEGSLVQQIRQPNRLLFSHAESLAESRCRQPNAPLISVLTCHKWMAQNGVANCRQLGAIYVISDSYLLLFGWFITYVEHCLHLGPCENYPIN
jgi:hypothetical protein